MSNTIDCSLMSHPACAEPEAAPNTASEDTASPTREESMLASYDCINECVSSLGVTTLVSGAIASLGCAALPPACPVVVGAAVGSVLGACNAACDELEAP